MGTTTITAPETKLNKKLDKDGVIGLWWIALDIVCMYIGDR